MKLELFKDAVLVSVIKRKFGVRRTIPTDLVDVHVGAQAFSGEKENLHLAKDIMDADEFAAVKAEFRRFDVFLAKRRVPGNFFRSGCFVIKKARVPEVYAEYQQRRAAVKAAVELFLERYPDIRAKAISGLKELADPADYPTPDELRDAIDLRIMVVELTEPDIDPEVKAAQAAEAEADWQDAIHEVRLALRTSMAEFVAHFAERLAPSEDGNRKIITEAKVTRFREFLEFFNDRDITDDAQLRELVNQAKGLLNGASTDAMRNDAAFRAELKQAFGAMSQSVGAMVQEEQARVFTFEA